MLSGSAVRCASANSGFLAETNDASHQSITVRTTSDAHFGVGVDRGDDRWETGGFIVHFFDRALIDRLAGGFEILEVADFEEGRLPRRLVAVTMRKH